MARLPRKWIVFEGGLFHVTWQCHNRDFLLKPMWAKKMLYDTLLKYKDQYGIIIFSYIIMDNHLHLSGLVPDKLTKFSRYFQVVHSVFAKKINLKLNRCGQVIRDRFKSPLVQDENALSRLMIYHDLNEVRCGKSRDPKKNQMSSYAHYAFGKPDPLITQPEFYLNLGRTPKARQEAYRGLVLEILIAAPRKKDGSYTNKLYIGDPLWVEKKYEELSILRMSIGKENGIATSDPPKII